MALESETVDDLGTAKLADEPEVTEDAKEKEPAPKGEETEEVKAEEAGDAEDGEDAGEEDDAEPAPAKKRRPGKAARKITRLEARNAELNERLARLEGAAEARAPAPASEPQAPREEDFESTNDFLLATAKHEARLEARKEFEAERAERDKGRQTEQLRERVTKFNSQIEAAREEHEDFDELVFADDLRISESMFQVMAETEHGAEIAYELGSNPAEARRIAALSVASQARELGKIEARLESRNGSPPQKKITAAPDPVKKVKPGISVATPLEKMSQDEFEKARLASRK
ncbi:MAG: hypothetical protein ACR2RF_00285 [Geminicoccaceae bacterium]